ncbi:MAG: hypothetical protein H7839_00915 [Magnetococcus sp. YQC-5]
MSTITADIQVSFDSSGVSSTFDLVAEGTDQEGNKPVIVDYETKAWALMQLWGQIEWKGNPALDILKVLTEGEKRVKLFCPKAAANSIRIFVDNDKNPQKSMGRRYDEITEAVTWSNEVWKSLRYPYDNPKTEIIEKTAFRDKTGKIIADPVYDKSKGGFFTTTEAIGALVVRYQPGYSLFNIKYDNGKSVASSALFEEMQKCWTYGDIRKASVPPVRLVAVSDSAAITAQFERSFWPNGFQGVTFGPADLYTEIKGTRETKTSRLFPSEDDDETFVEVKKTLYFEGKDETGKKLKFRFLNDAESI